MVEESPSCSEGMSAKKTLRICRQAGVGGRDGTGRERAVRKRWQAGRCQRSGTPFPAWYCPALPCREPCLPALAARSHRWRPRPGPPHTSWPRSPTLLGLLAPPCSSIPRQSPPSPLLWPRVRPPAARRCCLCRACCCCRWHGARPAQAAPPPPLRRPCCRHAAAPARAPAALAPPPACLLARATAAAAPGGGDGGALGATPQAQGCRRRRPLMLHPPQLLLHQCP